MPAPTALTPIPLPPDRDPELALPPPAMDGCRWCSDPKDGHRSQWHPEVGFHDWEQPTDKQVEARALIRRSRLGAALRYAARGAA